MLRTFRGGNVSGVFQVDSRQWHVLHGPQHAWHSRQTPTAWAKALVTPVARHLVGGAREVKIQKATVETDTSRNAERDHTGKRMIDPSMLYRISKEFRSG